MGTTEVCPDSALRAADVSSACEVDSARPTIQVRELAHVVRAPFNEAQAAVGQLRQLDHPVRPRNGGPQHHDLDVDEVPTASPGGGQGKSGRHHDADTGPVRAEASLNRIQGFVRVVKIRESTMVEHHQPGTVAISGFKFEAASASAM